MKKIVFMIGLICSLNSMSQESFNDVLRKATECYAKKDYPCFTQYSLKAVQLQPGSSTACYNLACGYALTHQKDKAIKELKSLLKRGLAYNFAADGDFDSIKESEEFKEVVKLSEAMRQPVVNSEKGFVVPEKDLIPEGMAYDPVNDCFYMGSLYKCKIIKIGKDLKAVDFTSSRQDGLLPLTGMKVDADRQELWACSCYGYIKEGLPKELLGSAGIFKYNLKTGALIKKYTVPKERNDFFNDVVVAKDGTVYLSNSHNPGIHIISPETDTIELFVELKEAGYPNGIAMSDDQTTLFLAHGTGVYAINRHTKKVTDIAVNEHTYIGGCDGLYFYKHSLIGIQNGISRIARFYLNNTFDRVERMDILEAYNPEFRIPTTGAIKGDTFYFISNSQLGAINRQTGKLLPLDQLQDVRVLNLTLK